MKKISLLLCVCLAITAAAQQSDSTTDQAAPAGIVATNANVPTEQVVRPTKSDLYCAGFVNKSLIPDTNYVLGGLQTPNTTKYGDGELVYLTGKGYEVGKRYSVIRDLHDPNRYEIFAGQFTMLRAMGQPYDDVGIIRVLDTRQHSTIAQIEMSCIPIMPGDVVVPFVERASMPAHGSLHFDRFAPPNGKAQGRIVMAKDFDTELGTGAKVYVNLGSNQGVKVGDYFRAVRTYEADLHNAADSLSFKASVSDDTEARPPVMEKSMLDHEKGPVIHVADFPRRSVGEIVILSTTPTTATGMLVFALEDVHVGDGVELDPQ